MIPDDKALSDLIRGHATRHAAPEALRSALQTQLALDSLRRPPQPAPARRGWKLAVPAGWRFGSMGFGAGVLCAALAMPVLQASWNAWALQPEVVACHIHALQANALVDVVSSDRHTVKPWFQGRVDYAPPVYDFAEQGFALAGGRIEHLRGNAVATLAFRRDRHVIDLYVWPADGKARPPEHATERGFNIVHWSDGAMQYWAVSDVERPQLDLFTALWRSRTATL